MLRKPRSALCALALCAGVTSCTIVAVADEPELRGPRTISGATHSPGTIDGADVVYRLDPARRASYRYATLACLGANRYWWEWTGTAGRALAPAWPLFDGSGAFRAGVVADPDKPNALAFELSVMPDDGDVSGIGTKRCEIALGWTEYAYPSKVPVRSATLPRNQDFWWGIRFRLDDWRATNDRQVIFQWLPGGGLKTGPMLTLQTQGERMWLAIQHDYGPAPSAATLTKVNAWTMNGWLPKHWYTAIIHARIDDVEPGNGHLALWLDGRQVLDYRGPIGFAGARSLDYAKFGLYHWTHNNAWDMTAPRRTAWYKGPALIVDRGAYDVARVTRFLD